MKKLALIICVLSIGCLTTGFAQTTSEETLEPFSAHPSEEEKTYYELDKEYTYKIYDFKGDLLSEGKAKFIDVTDLNPGVYFIAYADQKVRYIKPGVAGGSTATK